MSRSGPTTLVLTGLCVFFTGSSEADCNTTLTSLDLGCLLQWDCPHTNTTMYTVQTMTQGGPSPWQNVEGCVRVSSRQCDASKAFSEFGLYNMIRLGVHDGLGSPVWDKPLNLDPIDFTFSRPTVSVALSGNRLKVEVHFPCSTNRGKSCCPVSELIDPWVTVTVYNQQNSYYKTLTVWAQELVNEGEFPDLVPGIDYCVVANFSFGPSFFLQSPLSLPRCVHNTAPRPGTGPGLKPGMVAVGVCLLLFLSLPAVVPYFFKQRRQTPPTNTLPQTLASLQESLHDPPGPSDPIDLRDIQVDIVDDHLSILSSFSGCVYTEAQAPSLEDGYSSNLIQSEYKSGNMHWDTGGMELGLHFGSALSLPRSSGLFGIPMKKCRVDSLVQSRPEIIESMLTNQGSPEAAGGCVKDHRVPLSSVRFGVSSDVEEGEKLECLQWCDL
ncbi:hypothetical protein DPEC_G00105230 [Dallia pectoralis]|uniref:Uncharacterized protein n=1 Tax=Dallia pectoralis TaxID=75939 RepID=A0ACC2GXZ9_DALPE|nr:hypothetical protein DPEC_G00105230 [Dallia pectoralis]